MIVVGTETYKFFVKHSEGFSYISSVVTKDKTIHDQIGEIKYIAIGNSLSFGLSFHDSGKRLKTNLTVFGASGKINVDIKARKNADWAIEELKINN